MSIHLNSIEKAVSSTFSEIEKNKSVSVQLDSIITNGVKYLVRRLFLNADDSGEYRDCGWILKDDIKHCMVCGKTFDGQEVLKNNCRACGNVVCNHCSPETAIIAELLVNEHQRVCMLCFWGQDVVEATLHSDRSRSETDRSSIENYFSHENKLSLISGRFNIPHAGDDRYSDS